MMRLAGDDVDRGVVCGRRGSVVKSAARRTTVAVGAFGGGQPLGKLHHAAHMVEIMGGVANRVEGAGFVYGKKAIGFVHGIHSRSGVVGRARPLRTQK